MGNKLNPVQFLFKNRKFILSKIKEKEFNLHRVWDSLKAKLPDIQAAMTFKDFENYIAYLPLIETETEKILEETRSKLTQLDKPDAILEGVVQENVQHNQPKNIEGWTVNLTKKGYYRLQKKIKGKGYSIYLGKSFDFETAKQKIGKKIETINRS